MTEIRLGVYEKSMPADLSFAERLTAAKKAGFDHVEISIDETDARLSRIFDTKDLKKEIRNAIETVGLPIPTMCLSAHRKYPFGSHDPEIRKRGMEIMRAAVDFSVDIGVRLIQLAGYDVYYEEGDSDTRAWFFENLVKAVDYAASRSVTLGFETMETPFMDTVSKGMDYVDRVGSCYLGMYPDLGNLTNGCYLYDLSVKEEIERGRGHLFAMHLKETVEGVYRDMDFGTGRVRFAEGIRKALDCGVRLFTAEFWDDGRDDWQGRLSDTNAFLRERFAEAEKEKE